MERRVTVMGGLTRSSRDSRSVMQVNCCPSLRYGSLPLPDQKHRRVLVQSLLMICCIQDTSHNTDNVVWSAKCRSYSRRYSLLRTRDEHQVRCFKRSTYWRPHWRQAWPGRLGLAARHGGRGRMHFCNARSVRRSAANLAADRGNDWIGLASNSSERHSINDVER